MTDSKDLVSAGANSADATDVCAHCGEPVDTTKWHPIRSVTKDDEFHVYAFCDEDCLQAWTDDADAD